MTLSVRNLTYRVGRQVLVDDATFEVSAGRVVALVGPNGAGKSTLLRMVSGAVRSADPAQARVELDGENLLALPRRARARKVALVEQQARPELSVTVEQVVRLGRTPDHGWWSSGSADDEAIVAAAMKLAGVGPWAQRQLSTLSGGEQQRVHLARAIAQQPRLLLLDEPTNHLDIAAQLEILALISDLAAAGTTVLVALHDLSMVLSYCDEAVLLNGGRVHAAGQVQDVIVPALVGDIYRVSVDVITHPRTRRPAVLFSRPQDRLDW